MYPYPIDNMSQILSETIEHIEVTTDHIILTYKDHREIIWNNEEGKRYIDDLTNDKLKRKIEIFSRSGMIPDFVLEYDDILKGFQSP